MNRSQYILLAWALTATFLVLGSIVLAVEQPAASSLRLIVILALAQLGTSILFPILVSYFYDRFRRGDEISAIWNVFGDLSGAGIMRIYRDRDTGKENAISDIQAALDAHSEGELRLVGVTLRVFFQSTAPLYERLQQLSRRAEKHPGSISIRVLVSAPDSPEIQNRAAVETPGAPDPLIRLEARGSVVAIENLNRMHPSEPISYGFYRQAPYCTCFLFPDRCYYLPNILSVDPPAELPVIVFDRNSVAYRKLSDYFEYLWESRVSDHGPA